MCLSKVLSKQDAICLLELIHAAHFCQTEQELRDLMKKLHDLTPHEFAVSALASTDAGEHIKSYKIVNISYPEEWLDLYHWKEYHMIDPIVKTNFREFGLQYWKDTYRLARPPKDFLSDAEEFGLKEGYTYGSRGSTGTYGSLFSIAGESVEHDFRTEVILEHIIPHFHQALLRVADVQEKRQDVTLSQREQEVLEWIKRGKHTWEISTLLNVSENTIKFHVKNIFQKLDVICRTQAVAVAIKQGLITLD